MTDPSSSTAATEFLTRLPKVDLHCHLIGTVRAETFAHLVRAAGTELPAAPEVIYRDLNSLPPDPALYRHTRVPVPQGPAPDEPALSFPLFQVSQWVEDALRTADDLTRITYEAFEQAHTQSGTRHLELFIDDVPPHLQSLGFAGMVAACVDGIKLAERDFGMSGLLIQSLDRSKSAEHALAVVRRAIDHRDDHLVGVGLANLETAGPPERFAEAYRLAGDAGLFRTAHSSEHAPVAANTITCLDVLGCDRIDHGYYVLEDDDVVARCRHEQVPFTVITTTSRRSWIPWRKASIARMLDEGLNVLLASDDPGMFPTTLTREYQVAHGELGVPIARLVEMTLSTIDACWLPSAERARLRSSIEAEIATLHEDFGVT